MTRPALIKALFGALLMVMASPGAGALEVERVISEKGIEAWLVEDHTNPIIALRFAFRGGASLDPDGKDGLADMVSATIDEGAGGLDSQAFQGRLDDLSITLRFDAGRDVFGGNVKTLTKNRDAAFDLLALALTRPRFDEEPVERIRAQIVAGLKRDMEDPDTVASRTIMLAFYPSHPYGRLVKGTLESVASISAGDLGRFVDERLALDNLVIGAVGDINPEELAALLDGTFAGLPEKAAPWKIPEAEPAATGATLVIEKAVPQSAIVFGHEGVKRDSPDFYTAYVMNHILGGGGFTSRLYYEVREKRGLAYSVHSQLYPLDFSALIMGGAGTANAQVSETLDVVRREWRRMADEGVTENELADAKTYMTGSFPLRFTSSGRIASILVGMQLDGLGIDYLDRRNSLIEAVTLDGVNRLAKGLLDPRRLTFVVVGEPEGLAP